jgi:hypothetical protein
MDSQMVVDSVLRKEQPWARPKALRRATLMVARRDAVKEAYWEFAKETPRAQKWAPVRDQAKE